MISRGGLCLLLWRMRRRLEDLVFSSLFLPFFDLGLVLEAISLFFFYFERERHTGKRWRIGARLFFFDDEWILLVDLLEITHEGGRFE
jgi:hypothetical protein